MGVLGAVLRPELASEPERVQVVVVPVERGCSASWRSTSVCSLRTAIVLRTPRQPSSRAPNTYASVVITSPPARGDLTLRVARDGPLFQVPARRGTVALSVHGDLSATGKVASSGDERDTKAARPAARRTVGGYHAAQLAELIEHVREGLVRYEAGEIDAFDLDEVIPPLQARYSGALEVLRRRRLARPLRLTHNRPLGSRGRTARVVGAGSAATETLRTALHWPYEVCSSAPARTRESSEWTRRHKCPMLSSMSRRGAMTLLAFFLAVCGAGCGSSGRKSTPGSARLTSPLLSLRMCLRKNGYAISPESIADIGTAPRRFEFVAVWNVVNPSRVALALTFSRDTAGAEQAAVWTRRENAELGRRAVVAPVVRIGKIDVLWTAEPGADDVNGVYNCVRQHA